MAKTDSIPGWSVQQAYKYDPVRHPIPEGTWFSLSQKLNGTRATYYKGRLISRQGKEFHGLDHIVDALNWYDPNDSRVFDGELMLKPGYGKGLSDNERFRKSTGIINSNATEKPEIFFYVYDVEDVITFDAGLVGLPYRLRLRDLGRLRNWMFNSADVRVLQPLYQGTDQSMIPKLLDQMVAEDKEGLMINLDVPYLRKRHRGIQKVKRFYTMDLRVRRVVQGIGKNEGKAGSLLVDFEGNEVGVGTGFTDAQREWFWVHRGTASGMIVEVKYKEISQNKLTGKRSLQFPVFVRIRDDKKEVSYE